MLVPAGSQLWRVHGSSRGAVWFGPAQGDPPRNRFDAPGGEYGVCYFGESPEVAVAETIIRQPFMRLVQRTTLEARTISRVPVLRDLTLARLHGPGLVRMGIGAEVVHGHPYARCQKLALELWSHPDEVDGIEYRSRWDNDRLNYALFDRAADALDAPDRALNLGDPAIFNPILWLYDVGVA
ncbi:MAG TPA: RES family NAD+ phosphorylase [Longimicrobiaceae bacterium]